jgi:hypothetical protein
MEQRALIEMIKSHLLALIVIVKRNLIDKVVARMEIIGLDLLLHLASRSVVTAPPHRKLTVSPEGYIAFNSFSSCRLVALLSEMEQRALIEMIKIHLLALIVIVKRNLIDINTIGLTISIRVIANLRAALRFQLFNRIDRIDRPRTFCSKSCGIRRHERENTSIRVIAHPSWRQSFVDTNRLTVSIRVTAHPREIRIIRKRSG